MALASNVLQPYYRYDFSMPASQWYSNNLYHSLESEMYTTALLCTGVTGDTFRIWVIIWRSSYTAQHPNPNMIENL